MWQLQIHTRKYFSDQKRRKTFWTRSQWPWFPQCFGLHELFAFGQPPTAWKRFCVFDSVSAVTDAQTRRSGFSLAGRLQGAQSSRVQLWGDSSPESSSDLLRSAGEAETSASAESESAWDKVLTETKRQITMRWKCYFRYFSIDTKKRRTVCV